MLKDKTDRSEITLCSQLRFNTDIFGQVEVDQPTKIPVPAVGVKHDIPEADISMENTTLQQHIAVP